MMKLKEMITTSKGLFSYINEVNPLPWDKVVPPEDLDIAFMFAHGEKTVTGKVLDMFSNLGEDETLKQLAKVISTRYNNKWLKLYEGFSAEYPLNVVSRETLDDTVNKDNSTTNKVSAYDSEELTTDTGIDDNGTTTHTYTKDNISLDAYNKNVELLQDNLIYDKIFLDVKNLITLSIY